MTYVDRVVMAIKKMWDCDERLGEQQEHYELVKFLKKFKHSDS